jgi:hypothetical protein
VRAVVFIHRQRSNRLLSLSCRRRLRRCRRPSHGLPLRQRGRRAAETPPPLPLVDLGDLSGYRPRELPAEPENCPSPELPSTATAVRPPESAPGGSYPAGHRPPAPELPLPPGAPGLGEWYRLPGPGQGWQRIPRDPLLEPLLGPLYGRRPPSPAGSELPTPPPTGGSGHFQWLPSPLKPLQPLLEGGGRLLGCWPFGGGFGGGGRHRSLGFDSPAAHVGEVLPEASPLPAPASAVPPGVLFRGGEGDLPRPGGQPGRGAPLGGSHGWGPRCRGFPGSVALSCGDEGKLLVSFPLPISPALPPPSPAALSFTRIPGKRGWFGSRRNPFVGARAGK